jgi:hypothetical protein
MNKMKAKQAIHLKMLKFSRTVWTSLMMFMIVLAAFGLSATSIGYAESAKVKKAPQALIKAGYLYKFIFFVQWPDEKQPSSKKDKKEAEDVSIEEQSGQLISDEDITIGILGDDPFGDYLEPIEGRVIKSLNKKVVIKRFGPYTDGINLKQCHILYICSSEEENIERILSRTNGNAILTVADIKGFLELGGMVNLIDINGLIRWEINLAATRRSGLKISSTLIQSAVMVISAP